MTSRIAGRSYPEKKKAYFLKFNDLLDKYNKILVVLEDNVQSMQMHQIRIALRGVAEVIMGKNTMMKKVITDRAARTESERDKQLHQKLVTDGLLRNNVGLILTNGDLNSILKVIETNRVQAPARQGAISPCEVVIPAGNTGMEPTKTSFFQALNLQTKISKGTVELVKDVTILNVGDRVGSSEAALLQMLKINPFYYGLEVQHVYDNGAVYGLDILRITDEDMAAKFGEGLGNVTALSLALGFTTQASLPHVLANAFKDVFSVSLGTSYDFEACGAKALKQAIKEGKPIGGAAPASKGAAAPKAEAAKEEKPAKKEEPEEEEDADMGFGLFD